MKKSDEIRRKTWRMVAKNLIVLAALAVAAFVGVMSWFTAGGSNSKATGISMSTYTDDGLEFYVMPPSDTDQYEAINQRLHDNALYNQEHPGANRRTTWHSSSDGATFDFADQEFKFMEDLFLCEVTGDGTSFKIPKLLQYDNVAYVDTTQDFDTAIANDEYMSFDVYFRSENSHSVMMVNDTTITPAETYEAAVITNPSDNQKKDAAIGAVRMAVLNMESSAFREVLWIPAPYVYYNGIDDKLYTGLSTTEYDGKGAVYYNGTGLALRTEEGTNTHAYYRAKDDRQVIRSDLFVGRELGSDKNVVTLGNDAQDGYYYGHIRVNLWIEGEDAEARLAFVGGKFKILLHFMLNENN
ncbi:MAG: hypothetical protein IJ598_05945 [Ruminococcus sp.]|nr:hypothetical protein [Ruminococcus sp.]